jgi:predicted phage baseplate assembly protein
VTTPAPRIDARDRAALVAGTEELAQQLSPWRRPTDGRPDAGQALISVVARFAELVVDRLNRSLDKNHLAFLDLIGATPLPPRPAAVPLTFTLAGGTAVAPVVPAGTRVGGPPPADGQDEVVFETEEPLVCTTAALVAAWVSDTETDTAADVTAAATGAADTAFAAFAGRGAMPLTPHELHIGCDPLFDAATSAATAAARDAAEERADAAAAAAVTARSTATARAVEAARAAAAAAIATDDTTTVDDAAAAAAGRAGAAADAAAAAERAAAEARAAVAAAASGAAADGPLDVTVDIRSTDLRQWSTWPVSWAYWDGAGWHPVAAVGAASDDGWSVRLPAVAAQPTRVGGLTARFVRGRLDLALPPPETGLAPEALAVGMRNPQDTAFPLAPYDGTAGRFYLSADDAFSAAGSVARLRIELDRPGAAPAGLQLTWSYQGEGGWTSLAAQDATQGLTRDGTVTIPVPMDWSRTVYRSRVGRWLRVDLTGADYTTTPVISAMRIDVDWDLPRVDGLTVAAGGPGVAPSACVTVNDFTPVVRDPAGAAGFPAFSPTADLEPALHLGFDRPFEPRPMTLHLQVEPPRPEEVAAAALAGLGPATAPRLVWEYSGPSGWRPLGALDGTAGLAVAGELRFPGPPDLTARRCFDREAHWLRARWTGGTFPVPPRLRRVLTNTARASHGTAVAEEILGSATGEARQRFRTAQVPVQPGHRLVVRERERPPTDEEQALRVEEGEDAVTVTTDAAGLPDEVWVRWHAVPDLHASGPRDRHYTLDGLTGLVGFGDGTTGLVPPPGQNNVRVSYWAGGGARGNRPAATLTELHSAIPSVDAVTNLEPAVGGTDTEPLDRLAARGARVLRHRDRAVAASDLEDLVVAASPAVARAVAIGPTFSPYTLWPGSGAAGAEAYAAAAAGRVGVVVVPHADPVTGPARPTPDVGLLREVREHLARRLPATAQLWVAGPEWITVSVAATVVAVGPDRADAAAIATRAALTSFLHPLAGGPDGTGWAFADRPRRSALIALVERLADVDHVRSLSVALHPETADPDRAVELRDLLERPLRDLAGQAPPDPELVGWLGRALVCSGAHTVTAAFDA